MDKIFESKFMKALQAAGEKIGSNKAVNSIQAAFMGSMGIIMVGAVFQLSAVIPTIFNVFEVGSDIYNILYAPYNLSMNFLSVWFVFQLGYNYAKQLGLKPMTGAINSTLCFFLLVTEGAQAASMTAITTGNLGGTGLFLAILVGIITVRIYHLCVTKKIVIRMPDVVPPFLADGFSAIVPAFFSIVLWTLVNVVCTMTMGTSFPNLFIGLLAMPLSYLTGVWGMIALGLIAGLMWIFGIHGTMMVYVAIMPVMLQATAANAAAYAAGGVEALVYYPVALFGMMACAGGTGNTLALAVLGLKAKSEQIRAVAKAGVIPGVFNINEPITFGYPIMYNPILAIPYLLAIVVPMFLGHLAFSFGLLRPGFIAVGSVMPVGIAEFLSSLNPMNLIFPWLMVLVTGLIYYPFLKAYDKQLYAKEQEAKALEEGQSA